jgi:hypothetical protein
MPLVSTRKQWAFLPLGLTLALAGCGDAGPGSGEPVGAAAAPITPFTFPNDVTVCQYFVGKGLTAYQAAGIVGNLDQESGASPTAIQQGGPGRGIAQWSQGGRWDTDANDNAVAYASQQGQDVWSLGLQLDFIWYELTTFSGYGLGALRASTDVTGATVAFETDFEGCGQCNESQRIAYAQSILPQCGSPPDWAAQFVAQSFPLASTTMNMVEGEVVPSWIELKNTGTKTWDSNTKIGTTQPRDRSSVFKNGTWLAGNRLAAVQGTVPPGGTYKFTFDLAAPAQTGTFDEFFGVVQEGVAWFSDPGQGGPPDNDLEVKIAVALPDYRGDFKDQSFPLSPSPVTVHQGDLVDGYIELTNGGAQPWKAGTTKLAPIPRDKPSAFADKTWLSPTRISSVAADVAPGAASRFPVMLDTPQVGDFEVTFGLVEENVTWFADPTLGGGPADGFLKVHLVVVPKGASLDAGLPAGDGGVPQGGGGDGGGISPGGDGGSDLGATSGDSGGCALTASRGEAAPWGMVLGAAIALGGVARRRRGVRPRP